MQWNSEWLALSVEGSLGELCLLWREESFSYLSCKSYFVHVSSFRFFSKMSGMSRISWTFLISGYHCWSPWYLWRWYPFLSDYGVQLHIITLSPTTLSRTVSPMTAVWSLTAPSTSIPSPSSLTTTSTPTVRKNIFFSKSEQSRLCWNSPVQMKTFAEGNFFQKHWNNIDKVGLDYSHPPILLPPTPSRP